MTYRLRSKRAQHAREYRRRNAHSLLVGFTSACIQAWAPYAIYGHDGVEKPSPGFTPNEHWEPRVRYSLFLALLKGMGIK